MNRKELVKKGAIKLPKDSAYAHFAQEQENIRFLLEQINADRVVNKLEEGGGRVQLSGSQQDICAVAEDLLKQILKIYVAHQGKWNAMKTSREYHTFATSTTALHAVDMSGVDDVSKTCFWLNVFNTFLLHMHVIHGPPINSHMRKTFFTHYQYLIGDCGYTLQDIKDGILRGESNYFRSSDQRREHVVPFNPRIHFAVSSLNQASPHIYVYNINTLEEDLHRAGRLFLKTRVKIDVGKKEVTLPTIFDTYFHDFATGKKELLKWIFQFLSTRKRLELVLILEEKNCTVKYADISTIPFYVIQSQEKDKKQSPEPEPENTASQPPTPTKRAAMKAIDHLQTDLYYLWKCTATSVSIDTVLLLARMVQRISKELEEVKNGNDHEMLLLSLVRSPRITLTDEQKRMFGAKEEQMLTLLKATSSKLREIDCMVTHYLMSLTDTDFLPIYELITRVQKIVDEGMQALKLTKQVDNKNTALVGLRECIVQEIREITDMLRSIASDLKCVDIYKDNDQRLLLITTSILAFAKKQLENPARTLAPLQIFRDQTKIVDKNPKVFSKLNELKTKSKCVLVWVYQQLKSLAFTLSQPNIPTPSDLVDTGNQIRNIRNALSYIKGKKAKARNNAVRLFVNESRLTVKLMDASLATTLM